MTPAQRHIRSLVTRVGLLYELTPADVLTEGHASRAHYEARRLVYLVAHVALGLSTVQIAEAVGDTHQSVRSHITRAVAQTKSSRVFRHTYSTLLKQTVRDFERFGLEIQEAAE